MSRFFVTCSLIMVVASVYSGDSVSAQRFIPQTHPIPGAGGGTHADAMRILGQPGRPVYNQGLPMQDTYGASPNTSFNNWNRPNWRGNTIFNPGARQFNYQPQFNAAQLQQSIQNFSNAVRQFRQNRNNWQRNQYNNRMFAQNRFRRW